MRLSSIVARGYPRLGTAAGALLTSAIAAALLATPATASVKGLSYKSASKMLNNESTLNVKVPCSAGSKDVGGGVSNSFGIGSSLFTGADLNQSRPMTVGKSKIPSGGWIAAINNASGQQLTENGYAVCATKAFVSKVDYVTTPDVTLPSGGRASAIARCPTGTKILSGGAYTGGYLSMFVSYPTYVSSTEPVNADTAWKVVADSDHAGDDVVRAYAICAKPQAVGAKLSYVVKSLKVPSMTQGKKTAPCPKGDSVVGGGVSNNGGYNQAEINTTAPSSKDNGWVGHLDNYSGGLVKMKTYAICAS